MCFPGYRMRYDRHYGWQSLQANRASLCPCRPSMLAGYLFRDFFDYATAVPNRRRQMQGNGSGPKRLATKYLMSVEIAVSTRSSNWMWVTSTLAATSYIYIHWVTCLQIKPSSGFQQLVNNIIDLKVIRKHFDESLQGDYYVNDTQTSLLQDRIRIPHFHAFMHLSNESVFDWLFFASACDNIQGLGDEAFGSVNWILCRRQRKSHIRWEVVKEQAKISQFFHYCTEVMQRWRRNRGVTVASNYCWVKESGNVVIGISVPSMTAHGIMQKIDWRIH